MPESAPPQIIFNERSAAELAQAPKLRQLELLTGLRGSFAPPGAPPADPERHGGLRRDGRTLHRFRSGEWRVYFERVPEGLAVRRILHRNTVADFLFRSNLPMPDEDAELVASKPFWELIEEGRQAPRRRPE